MDIEFLNETFREHRRDEFLVWRDESHGYAWLLERIDTLDRQLREATVGSGAILACTRTSRPTPSPHSCAASSAAVH